MIKKILAFIVLVGCMQTALYAQENQNRTLINAALHGWEYEIRAGVSIGGTSPLPLPVEIRSIDAYNPTLAFMLEGNAIKWLGKTKKWGVITGVRLETKNMITKATVKNYGMEIIGNDGNRLKGNWTGGVKTKVRNAYITVPVLGAYKINSRLRAKAGIYVSYLMDEEMSELKNRIDSLLNGKKATVGIAVWTDKGDMLRYNDHVHFPLLSVFKFHVALAVLDKMDKQSISLDSIVSIKASQMLPNTYSPLRKKFPDQDFTITLRELMQYSISQSDNNACDILIEYAGGIKHINDYIHRLSIDSFNLSETEDGMHSSFEAVYRNWSTPSAMARLLRTADEKELFSNKELKDFLWQTMIDTETGANKLKGMLPAKTVVGHKTGSSDRNADGMKTADNDAGLVILPDGRKYYIAAFVMDSYETDEDNANIIARISRMVYDAMR